MIRQLYIHQLNCWRVWNCSFLYGISNWKRNITLIDKIETNLDFILRENNTLDEVVITGTLKPVSRLESRFLWKYTSLLFKKKPYDQYIWGASKCKWVRPQLNCNVCNTGDIHINGLEGPYTLVLIDGMPIVSGLSTVYGLSEYRIRSWNELKL
jgi:outer membrane receptor for ferrienterochelin and colicins